MILAKILETDIALLVITIIAAIIVSERSDEDSLIYKFFDIVATIVTYNLFITLFVFVLYSIWK
ncbi:MAG: hypothetical protein [Cryophage ML09]|nr:MAG: hypothetical protein [Cryophage ML09]